MVTLKKLEKYLKNLQNYLLNLFSFKIENNLESNIKWKFYVILKFYKKPQIYLSPLKIPSKIIKASFSV